MNLFKRLFKSQNFEKPIKILDKTFTNIDEIDPEWYRNRHKDWAEKTDGEPYLEGDFIFIPVYILKDGERVYAGFETCVNKGNWELAKKMREDYTFEGLIRRSK